MLKCKVEKQFIVTRHGKWHVLYVTADKCFITTNGAFDQRETYIEEISKEEAESLLKNIINERH